MMLTQVQVGRKDFTQAQIVQLPMPVLADGEVLVAIDKFALTANNVSYALSGEAIGYWTFFPCAEPWGLVPVWGFADIIESRHPDLKVGERVWGFLPMASHLVLTPGSVGARSFVDAAAHRAGLPGVYNAYQRTQSDSPDLTRLEDARCLLFPLFSTSYVIYDYLIDNAFFGAEQVVIGSVSSKTGLGLANLLAAHIGGPKVVGLTSPGNIGFVQQLGTCDEIQTYAHLDRLDASVPTAFIDMAGNGDVVSAIHTHFGANLKLSCAVGATHWGAGRFQASGHGPAHSFFFAPAQFAKRDLEWGPGEIMRRAQAASARIALEMQAHLSIQHETGPEAVVAAFQGLVAGTTRPEVGIMASVTRP